jgi:hypothetical protein
MTADSKAAHAMVMFKAWRSMQPEIKRALLLESIAREQSISPERLTESQKIALAELRNTDLSVLETTPYPELRKLTGITQYLLNPEVKPEITAEGFPFTLHIGVGDSSVSIGSSDFIAQMHEKAHAYPDIRVTDVTETIGGEQEMAISAKTPYALLEILNTSIRDKYKIEIPNQAQTLA